jgi:PASTA domain
MPSRSSLRSVAALCAAFALAPLPAALHAQALSLGLVMPAAGLRSPPLVVVPDVRGQTLSGAVVRVANVGLVPRHAASSQGDLDTSPVRRQWPRAGQRVPQGTVVALELATLAAAPARTPAARSAAMTAESAARTMVAVSFEAHERSGDDSPAAPWWLAAAACAPLLALALRRMRGRRATPATARSQAAEPAAHPASGAAPVPDALGRLGRGVWVKPARGVPRLAIASAASIAATEVAEA